MSTNITLTSALQNNLQSLQKSKGAAAMHNNAPVDGNIADTSVQDAICTAAQDFCTQSLNNRTSELTQLLENLSQSIKTLEKSNSSIEELTQVIKDAEALALKAQNSADGAGFEQDLGAIEDRISAAVNKAKSASINLLAGDTLTTAFGNNERNAIMTEGLDLSPEALGFGEISFATPSSITDAIEIIRAAMDDTQSLRLTVAGDLKDIQTRQDFTQHTIGSLEEGKNSINVTALSEEGANLLALQTRMALRDSSFSLASQTQEDVLRLF